MDVLDILANLYVAITGLLAILLLTLGNHRAQAIGPFVGLAGQPAWLYIAFSTKAMGIGVVSVAYTFVWLAACVRAVKTWGDEPAGYRT